MAKESGAIRIYHGNVESARVLSGLLDDNGIACWIEELDDFAARHVSPESLQSDVWVEEIDGERARGVLAQWELGRTDRIAGAVARVRWVLWSSCVVPALYAAVTWASSEDLKSVSVPTVFLLWLVSVIVLGFYENRRFVQERVMRPPGIGR